MSTQQVLVADGHCGIRSGDIITQEVRVRVAPHHTSQITDGMEF